MSGETVSRDETSKRPARGGGRRRRELLTGAAAATLGVIAAETLASATPAQATQGQNVLLGTDNTGATHRTGVFTTGNNEWAQLADPGDAGLGSQGVYGVGQLTGVRGEAVNGTGVIGKAGITGGGGGGNNNGVEGFGSGAGAGVTGTGGTSGGFGVVGLGNGSSAGVSGTGGGSSGTGVSGAGGPSNGAGVSGRGSGTGAGIVGTGGPTNGTGVLGVAGGNGDGVSGSGGAGSGAGILGTAGASSGTGVIGTSASPGGTAVLAENTAGGIALNVLGRAVFFLYSGILTVAAGSSSGTVTGIALTPESLVLATLQQSLSGLYVRSAVPNVAANSFTVHLSKAAPASANVAWFVVN